MSQARISEDRIGDLSATETAVVRPSAAHRRILFVSGFLPPAAPMGAIRTQKLRQYWLREGHDVRTIAIMLEGEGATRPEADTSVRYLHFREPGHAISQIKKALSRLLTWKRDATPGLSRDAEPKLSSRRQKVPDPNKFYLGEFYRQAVLRPDKYRSWVQPAVQQALSWSASWRPDVIYSSGPPHSSHLAAANLSERLGVPWIAELRDLWHGNPYADLHPLLRPLQDGLARQTLARAAGLVVVTGFARAKMQSFTDRPVVLSYNGYDPKDFADLADPTPLDPERLTIVHAGVIYLGRRDPTPLFKAIASLDVPLRRIKCIFYHDEFGSVAALAEQFGIADCVEIRASVPRGQILRIERCADVLLECRWQDASGDGVIPGKLFEYIGAQRPILSLGSLSGEAAAIVRDNRLGLASNDSDEIRAKLLGWLDEKQRNAGRVPDVSGSIDARFVRDLQFQKIDQLIETLLERSPVSKGNWSA